ncbi:hypothetical protein AB1L42_05510 [Thalassoglobus sp. JC818]|uniref:ArnT family glycosyltransferase n=1 Tax=Thalassoglobus sp. JC818 TaxID=3232136 RepID=UPI00345A3E54
MSGSTNIDEATFLGKVASFFRSQWFSWWAGLFATLFVIGTIDPAQELPFPASGPGLTFDEGFNIEVGVTLARGYQNIDWSNFSLDKLREIYADPSYNPDHPPLGRIALGFSHELCQKIWPIAGPCGYVVSYTRIASAIEFGLLVFFLIRYSASWFGRDVGAFVGISVLCMPRVFGHAHLASLESCTNLTWVLFLLVLADRWGRQTTPRARSGVIPGFFLGLVFLTKIQAIFLPPVVIVWALWNWKLRSILPMLVLFLTAAFVFYAGWPWLWIDPAENLKEYFASATERASLNCFYWGEKFADREVPWHYPAVMFLVTMPVAFLAAGWIGMTNRTGDENSSHAIFDPRGMLFFGAWLLPLLALSLPGVTVYDGVRLFLVSFPTFALFIGLGANRSLTSIYRRYGKRVVLPVLFVGLAGPIVGMVTLHPCQLSYYNVLTAGLWKAEVWGFEATYWGDSVTPGLLAEASEKIPENATLEMAPVLHPLQLEFMRCGSWMKHRPDIQLSAYDDARESLSPYVLTIHRRADPWASLLPPPEGTEVLASIRRQGVVLAEVLKLPEEAAPSDVNEP